MSCAVLVVNYKAYDALHMALASLGPHLGTHDQVVVVDYESDATALTRAMAACERATAVSRTDNRGFAAGVNLAAQHSTAPYLLLLNPDARLEGPAPQVLEGWLETHPDVGVVGPRVLDADGSVQASARRFPGLSTVFGGRSTWLSRRFPENWISARNLVGRDATSPTDVDWLAGSCFMTPRRVFDRVGGFDESFFLYWEDADYCSRVADAGLRRTYLPTVTVRHSAGASFDFARDRAIVEFHRSAARLYEKRAGRMGQLWTPAVRAGLNARSWWKRRRTVPRDGRGL